MRYDDDDDERGGDERGTLHNSQQQQVTRLRPTDESNHSRHCRRCVRGAARRVPRRPTASSSLAAAVTSDDASPAVARQLTTSQSSQATASSHSKQLCGRHSRSSDRRVARCPGAPSATFPLSGSDRTTVTSLFPLHQEWPAAGRAGSVVNCASGRRGEAAPSAPGAETHPQLSPHSLLWATWEPSQ